MGMKMIKRKQSAGNRVTEAVLAKAVPPKAVPVVLEAATWYPIVEDDKGRGVEKPLVPYAVIPEPPLPSSVFEHMAITRRQLSKQQLALSKVADALEVVERQRHEELVEKSSTEAVEAIMGTLLKRKDRRDDWMKAAFGEGKFSALAALSGDERKDIQFAAELAGLNRLVKRDERDGEDDANGKNGVTNVVMVRLDGVNGNVSGDSYTASGKTAPQRHSGTAYSKTAKASIYKDVVTVNARRAIEQANETVGETVVMEPEDDGTTAGPVFRRFALDVETEAVVKGTTPVNGGGVGRVERVREDED